MLVADLADDLFDQVFHGDHAGHAAVFIDHDGHVQIGLLHLAQQRTYPLGLGDKMHRLHHLAHGAGARVAIGDLQQIMGQHDADDVINIAVVNRHARVGFAALQFRKLFDGGIGGDGGDLRTRRHDFSHCLVAEFHN